MITITIGQASVNYQLCETNAPKAYDGPVIDIYDGGPGELRYILVREDEMVWQTRRNQSGMYQLTPSDAIPEAHLAQTLWERLAQTEAR